MKKRKVHWVSYNRQTACGRRTFETDCVVDVSGVTCKDCLKYAIDHAIFKQLECEVAMLDASVAQSILDSLK